MANLKALLQRCDLVGKNEPLYQLLKQLIANQGSSSSGTSVSGTTVVNTTSISSPIPGSDGEDGSDGLSIIGPAGAAGISNVPGPIGPMGAILFPPDAEDGDIFPPIAGPQGNPGPTGSQGPIGPSVPHEDVFSEDVVFPYFPPLPVNIQQTTEVSLYTLTGVFADVTGLTVNISPRFIASKVRIICSITLYAGTNNFVSFQILRGASVLKVYQGFGTNAGPTQMSVVLDLIDSPASISALTYKVQAKNEAGAGAINNVVIGGETTVTSSITVEEILQ